MRDSAGSSAFSRPGTATGGQHICSTAERPAAAHHLAGRHAAVHLPADRASDPEQPAHARATIAAGPGATQPVEFVSPSAHYFADKDARNEQSLNRSGWRLSSQLVFQKKEATMNTRQLGNSDLYITPIGFGAWAIGGSGWQFAWGGQDDSDSVAAIREALDNGVNWIDTAAVYGLGHSEEVVARALEGMGNRPYVFTKCSMVWDEQRKIGHSLKAESIRRECEASLRRLRVDAIDLYQIHWPLPDKEIEEGWTTMAKLKEEGKVRHIGVSNFDVGQMRRAQAIAPITSLQPRYSLIHREAEENILPFAAREDIGVIVYSPMGSGLLTGAMSRERIQRLPADDW